MAKQINVRGVPTELSRRIGQRAEDRGISVNATVLDILKAAVGLDQSARRSGLQRYTTWTEQDLQEFEAALTAQRVVDAKLWS
jgi:plasmid stability protein